MTHPANGGGRAEKGKVTGTVDPRTIFIFLCQ